MKLAYFDCFSGAAGDMIVGAMLDAGLDAAALTAALARLPLPGWRPSIEKVRRAGMAGTKFNVNVDGDHDHPHRHLGGDPNPRNNAAWGPLDILAIIDAAALPGRSAEVAKAIFQRLGEAEAKVHGIGIEEVHFHEVGAVDSIVDIVASAVGLELLGIGRVVCSPIPTGRGRVQTAHGLLPIPAPATVELLATGRALLAEAPPEIGECELTTPTAAAVLTTVAESFGPVPPMVVSAVGYGAGTRDHPSVPNLLRVIVGEAGEGTTDAVLELSANLDDCTGQVLGHAIEKLLAAGALDAWAAPICMKKSRPGWMLSALCVPADGDRIEGVFFAETPTLGVRRRSCSRGKLARRHETVATPYGPVRVKLGERDGRVLSATPECEDAAAAAEAHGVAVREVIAAAMAAYRTGQGIAPGRQSAG